MNLFKVTYSTKTRNSVRISLVVANDPLSAGDNIEKLEGNDLIKIVEVEKIDSGMYTI